MSHMCIDQKMFPTGVSGLLMLSLCKINALLAGSRWAGGGEGNAMGARAVDFKQGTCEDGNSQP
jgi:hypothetical protein